MDVPTNIAIITNRSENHETFNVIKVTSELMVNTFFCLFFSFPKQNIVLVNAVDDTILHPVPYQRRGGEGGSKFKKNAKKFLRNDIPTKRTVFISIIFFFFFVKNLTKFKNKLGNRFSVEKSIFSLREHTIKNGNTYF